MEKATITIENMENVATDLQQSDKKKSLINQASGKVSKAAAIPVSQLNKAAAGVSSQISKAAEMLLQKAGLGKEIPKPEAALPKASNAVITVQYNPTSLKISSSLEQVREDALSPELQEVYKKMGGACSFDLSVSLIYSSRYPTDTGVREAVNRFLAFITTSSDRLVTFAWGNHLFRGVMTNLNCRYQQFERTGNPTYATVDITLKGSPDIAVKAIDKMDKERNNKLIPETPKGA